LSVSHHFLKAFTQAQTITKLNFTTATHIFHSLIT